MEVPLLAGIEARVVSTRRGSRTRRLTEKAAAALADASPTVPSRPRDHFVPHGPAERKEGRSVQLPQNAPQRDDTPQKDNVETSGHDGSADQHPLDPVDAVINTEMSNDLDMSPLARNHLGIDILSELPGKYVSDPFFRAILDKPREFRNFEVKDQLIYLKESGKHVLCIPKINIQGRSLHELVISEAHSMLAHLGSSKTLDYLRAYVWWKDIVTDVKAFCETCHTCKISKPSNQKPYGLLNPLEVPSHPWESIGIDFVGPLPESGN